MSIGTSAILEHQPAEISKEFEIFDVVPKMNSIFLLNQEKKKE